MFFDMENKDLKNSAPEEQFSEKTENTESIENKENKTGTLTEESQEEPEVSANNTSETAEDVKDKDIDVSEKKTSEKEAKKEDDTSKKEVKSKPKAKTKKEPEEKAEEKIENQENESKDSVESVNSKEDNSEVEKAEDDKPEETREIIDYVKLSKEDIVKVFSDLLNNYPVDQIKNDIELIKVNFYKKHKQDLEKLKSNFIKEGGLVEDFKPQEDHLENEFKILLAKFKSLKSDYNKQLEIEKESNLEEKYKIIEEIKELANRKESINKTFNEFRELQKKWRDIGLVPQQKVKDLWETYHHHVEKFYDYIKINRELRDLDLKKNLELKITLCEKAEDLLIEPSVLKAFDQLQKLHERWRETGPVAKEIKDSTWERFKAATTTINKKYQAHFEELKKTQKKNLEAKTLLCEQVEDIINSEISNHKEWEEKSDKVKELQKVWKTIGFAPKKHNAKIYNRFRTACDQFFERKREYYAENKEIQANNLQTKLDLCEQAEALKESTDWKKTTEDLIFLQKQWKKVGPVPKKQSDEVWKRFRTACDEFFNRKKEYFSNIDARYEENLKLKEEIIKEIESFKLEEKVEDNIKKLKELQRRWADIGFVPFKDKERIQKIYREAINKQFDNLDIKDDQRVMLKFKNKIESIKQSPKLDQRLRSEREKYITKLKKLESNIVLWENNIGFFAKSKKADSMIEEVEQKITKAKKEIEILEEKISIIDKIE